MSQVNEETAASNVESGSPRPAHVHTDQCPHGCAETWQRSDLEKVVDKGSHWGGEIIAVHRVGEYAFVEHEERDYSGGPNYGKLTGKNSFSIFINSRSISRSADSLDEALVTAIAYKRDGCNSQAARFFMRATESDT